MADAGVAQLVEHLIPNQRAVGSSPTARAITAFMAVLFFLTHLAIS